MKPRVKEKDAEKIDELLADGADPEELGFEFHDREMSVSGSIKVEIEEIESEEERMERLAREVVADMKIGKQIKNLKLGEKSSLKLNISGFLNALNEKIESEKATKMNSTVKAKKQSPATKAKRKKS